MSTGFQQQGRTWGFSEADFRKGFRWMQECYLDYPAGVHIETNGLCNAKCRFCPQQMMPRRGRKMPDELFAKIVEDLKEIPKGFSFAISPFKMNEPLLDTRIFERISLLNAEFPEARIFLTSNFSLASEAVIEAMSKVRIAELRISLNSVRPDEYERLMGLPLAPTVAGIRRLLHANRKHRFVKKVLLSSLSDNGEADRCFVDEVQYEFAGFRPDQDYIIALQPRGTWMGLLDVGNVQCLDFSRVSCSRWFELSITCTGEVAFCCMDGLCKYPLGDVNRQSVLEVYNHPTYRELRRQGPPRSAVGPCVGCTFL